MTTSSLPFLMSTQNPDGGWSYAAGEPSVVEATAAVTLALQDQPDAAAARGRGLDLHVTAQQSDGAWGPRALRTLGENDLGAGCGGPHCEIRA